MPEPFLIEPDWEGDRLRFHYAGTASAGQMTENMKVIHAHLLGSGPKSQAKIAAVTGIHRKTTADNLKKLEELELAAKTGELDKQSPVWEATVTLVAGVAK